VRGVLEFNLDH